VCGCYAQVIEQIGEVFEISVEIDAALEIEVAARFAEPAQVEPQHAVKPAQVRNPCAPEFRRACVAVLQHNARRVFPRIGVIVELVMQARLARAFQKRHDCSSSPILAWRLANF
jgi:hypothetical protein